jgi:hypothetical protein
MRSMVKEFMASGRASTTRPMPSSRDRWRLTYDTLANLTFNVKSYRASMIVAFAMPPPSHIVWRP